MIVFNPSRFFSLVCLGAAAAPRPATFEVCLRARLRAGAPVEPVVPDDISSVALAARPEAAEVFAAPFKPRADLVLHGDARAPNGKAVASCRVCFAVGEHSRELLVIGDRRWDAAAKKPTEPLPFVTMPIRYERAYGGPRYADNPVGRGHAAEGDPPPVELPNILDPRDTEAGRVARAPAGFAPLPRGWGLRRRLGGTYDERWLAERWPDYPADLEPAYFNAAPPEMQVPYLRGDEEIVLENLHPEHASYRTRLPGQRARLFVLGGGRFEEVPLHLDTLSIDMAMELATLLWRGRVALADDARVYLVSEPLAEPPLSLEHYQRELMRALLEEEPQAVDLADEVPGNENDVQPAPEVLAAALAPVREMLVKAGASASVLDALDRCDADTMLDRVLAESGVTPAAAAAALERAQAETRRVFAEHGVDPRAFDDREEEEAPKPLGREDVIARHRAGESLAEEDLSGLDLSRLDLSGARLQGAILAGASCEGTNLAGAEMSSSNLAGARLVAAGLAGANLAEADLTGASLEGANLTGAKLSGAIVRDTDLRRATMTGVEARHAAFEGADLRHASLFEANLEEAYLGSCNLEQASFHRANLTRAVLERAEGAGADLSEANLTYLKAAEGVRLPSANLRGAKATRAVWAGADLRAADLSLSDMAGADLSGADLEGANLHGADLRRANLDQSNLARATATRANFFRASFIDATLEAADFRDANLYQAETLRSRRGGARFEGALLDGTKLAEDAPRLAPGV